MPEEVNRRIIDHSSDVLMPYTERSRQNLLQEGIPKRRIYVTGIPILEVIQYYHDQIEGSSILKDLNLEPLKYLLVTLHRVENVDVEERLRAMALALEKLQIKYSLPVIVSTHPHTRARLEDYGIGTTNKNILFLQPFGFLDFIKLEKNTACMLSGMYKLAKKSSRGKIRISPITRPVCKAR